MYGFKTPAPPTRGRAGVFARLGRAINSCDAQVNQELQKLQINRIFFFQIHTRYHVVFTFLFEQEYFAIFQLDRGVIWLRQYPQRILMRQAVQSV